MKINMWTPVGTEGLVIFWSHLLTMFELKRWTVVTPQILTESTFAVDKAEG